MYVSQQSQSRQDVRAYLMFWFEDAAGFAEAGGLVPSRDDVYQANIEQLQGAVGGGATPEASPATRGAFSMQLSVARR